MITITEQDYKTYFGLSDVPQPFNQLVDESKIIILSKLKVDVDSLTLKEPCATRIKNAVMIQMEYLVRYLSNGADLGITPSYVGIGEFLYSTRKDSNFNAEDDLISPRTKQYLASCGLYKEYKALSYHGWRCSL